MTEMQERFGEEARRCAPRVKEAISRMILGQRVFALLGMLVGLTIGILLGLFILAMIWYFLAFIHSESSGVDADDIKGMFPATVFWVIYGVIMGLVILGKAGKSIWTKKPIPMVIIYFPAEMENPEAIGDYIAANIIMLVPNLVAEGLVAIAAFFGRKPPDPDPVALATIVLLARARAVEDSIRPIMNPMTEEQIITTVVYLHELDLIRAGSGKLGPYLLLTARGNRYFEDLPLILMDQETPAAAG